MSAAEPHLLLLETSGRVGWVAVARGPTLLEARRLNEARRHARDLAPTVAELLAAQGWQPGDLDAVLASRGPGSYTGLRVGLMSAKTLAYATGCALVAVPTFAVIAEQAPPEVTLLDVIADAQQGKAYVQRFVRGSGGGNWSPQAALVIRPFIEWLDEREPGAWVAGPGLHVFHDRLPGDVPVVAAEAWNPHAESLLRVGLRQLRQGQVDDWSSVEPLYLRPSSAEEKRLADPAADHSRRNSPLL
jgi:tRNA threonylcarbamoyladenosine biosynthesis protein TsaB